MDARQIAVVIDPQRLLGLRIPGRRCRYTARDTMLYGLAVGFGSDPLDEQELAFVYEHGLKAVPTQATTVAWDRSWIGASGIDWPKVVHGEQLVRFARTFPPQADVVSAVRVAEVLDKGSGALMRVETSLTDAGTGELLCSSTTSFFIRGEGGFARGARAEPPPGTKAWPQRPPDAVDHAQTLPNQALLYRLCGDMNPHHVWPAAARAGGFDRPLLHGLCTYGFACRAVLRTFCEYDPARLASMDARFLAPVYPGDVLRFEFWRDGNEVSVRGFVPCSGRAVIEVRAGLR